MSSYLERVVNSLIEDIDEPLPALGLLFVAFVMWANLLDSYLGDGTPVASLLLSFVTVTLFIAVVKYRE